MQRARSSISESVSVYRFLDAREFLRAAYQQAKRVDPAFSHRYIARALRVTSSSFFPQLLAGKSRLTPARALAFARLFGLSAPETVYFEELVAYTEAVDPREKEHALEKMKAADPERRHALLDAYQAEYFRKWHYAAVRELLALHPFRGDYAALGKMLDPPLTAAAAREAVDLLLRLKLARKTPHGGCEPTERVVLSGPRISPEQVRPALEGHLDLARRALENHPAPTRPFSYATISVSEKSFREIREKFQAFRREVFDLVSRDAEVDRVYQMNFQLFPVSEIVARE